MILFYFVCISGVFFEGDTPRCKGRLEQSCRYNQQLAHG